MNLSDREYALKVAKQAALNPINEAKLVWSLTWVLFVIIFLLVWHAPAFFVSQITGGSSVAWSAALAIPCATVFAVLQYYRIKSIADLAKIENQRIVTEVHHKRIKEVDAQIEEIKNQEA